jgi:hypothetical protein
MVFKGNGNAVGKTGQFIGKQIKWLGLFMRFRCPLRYMLDVMFKCVKSYDVWQLTGLVSIIAAFTAYTVAYYRRLEYSYFMVFEKKYSQRIFDICI